MIKKFYQKYDNILNWIPVIGILFFIISLRKYKVIRMYFDEFTFWLLYETCCIALLAEIIKNYVDR